MPNITHRVHASGHCSREALEEIIKEIKPKVLIPIHTENPRMFEGLVREVIMIKIGKEIKI